MNCINDISTNRPKRKVFNYKNIKKHTIQVFFSIFILKKYQFTPMHWLQLGCSSARDLKIQTRLVRSEQQQYYYVLHSSRKAVCLASGTTWLPFSPESVPFPITIQRHIIKKPRNSNDPRTTSTVLYFEAAGLNKKPGFGDFFGFFS